MVKQSFFGLLGQYGRRVTKANYQSIKVSVVDNPSLADVQKLRVFDEIAKGFGCSSGERF